MMEQGNLGYACVFKPEYHGKHTDFLFPMTPKNIANFIGQNAFTADKIIPCCTPHFFKTEILWCNTEKSAIFPLRLVVSQNATIIITFISLAKINLIIKNIVAMCANINLHLLHLIIHLKQKSGMSFVLSCIYPGTVIPN